MSQRFNRPCFSMLFVLVLLASISATPARAVDCTSFAGLEHCATGNALLTTGDDGSLTVANLGGEGTDGVAVSLGQATTWVASLSLAPAADGGSTFSTTARADGQDISRADLRPNADGTVGLSASFTGGKGRYSVLVYRAGQLVASQGGLDSDRLIYFGNDLDFLMWLISMWTFTNRMADGSCGWMVEFTQDVAMQLPDGTHVTGDEVHLIEEVAKGGHYPYLSFDGITLTGNLSAIHLSDETVYP